MSSLPSVHRTILVLDVAGFADQRRTNPQQVAVRAGMYRVVREALDSAGISWTSCDHEDRGDGIFVLAPPDAPKRCFVDELPQALVTGLHQHNRTHGAQERIRLRMAVHAGEVVYDQHGVTGASINLAFRLVDAQPVKDALADSDGALAVVISAWFFDEVVRHSPTSRSETYRPVRVMVKETDTLGWVGLPDQPHPLDLSGKLGPAPGQLPLDVYGFAGRAEQLARLDDLLISATAEQPTAVVISAVSGTAGVGKTALAVHWAHRMRDNFPDGQLYANLRGFDPRGQPLAPTEVVRSFLDALGVPPHRIPPDLDARAALYRGLLDGRRVLVVLDNARDANHVRPLLPGSPTALVLVTSRNQLTGLVAVDGAHPLALDVLEPGEARELLARRLGPERVTAESNAVETIINHCARLPLALAIVAARANQSGFPLAALATELTHTGQRLDALDTGDPLGELRAVFSWSYHALTPAAAGLFRLIGLHPGPDLSAAAAANLTGLPPPQSRPLLTELTRASLLTERAPGRYTCHDLLRTYAASLIVEGQRQDALRRLLDYYLHTAYAAARLLHPARDPITIPLTSPAPGVIPEQINDHSQALEWLATEHPVLLAAVQQTHTRYDAHTWQLAWTLDTFLDRRGHWQDLTDAWQAGLHAARRLNHPTAQAHAHRSLARVHTRLGNRHNAYTHHRRALDLYAQAGDHTGRAATHHYLADLLGQQGHPHEAFVHARQALTLYQATNHRRGQALVLDEAGRLHALLGDHHQTLNCCQQALALFEDLSDHTGQATAWNTLGHAHHNLGHHPRAVACYQHALDLYRNLGDRYEEAVTLTHLGQTHHSAGDIPAARTTWQLALDILTDLDHPDTKTLRSMLHIADYDTMA